MSHRTARIVGGLAGLLVIGLSACAGDDGTPASPSGQAPAPSAGSTASTSEGGGSEAAAPEDFCVIVTAAQVSSVVVQELTARTSDGGCVYEAGGEQDLLVTIGAIETGGINLTLEEARVGTELRLRGTSEPMTVSGYKGFLVSGTQAGRPSASGAVELDSGLLVLVSMANGDPADFSDLISQLLEISIQAL